MCTLSLLRSLKQKAGLRGCRVLSNVSWNALTCWSLFPEMHFPNFSEVIFAIFRHSHITWNMKSGVGGSDTLTGKEILCLTSSMEDQEISTFSSFFMRTIPLLSLLFCDIRLLWFSAHFFFHLHIHFISVFLLHHRPPGTFLPVLKFHYRCCRLFVPLVIKS